MNSNNPIEWKSNSNSKFRMNRARTPLRSMTTTTTGTNDSYDSASYVRQPLLRTVTNSEEELSEYVESDSIHLQPTHTRIIYMSEFDDSVGGEEEEEEEVMNPTSSQSYQHRSKQSTTEERQGLTSDKMQQPSHPIPSPPPAPLLPSHFDMNSYVSEGGSPPTHVVGKSSHQADIDHNRVKKQHSIPGQSFLLSTLPRTSPRLTPSPTPTPSHKGLVDSIRTDNNIRMEMDSDNRIFNHCGSSLLPGPPCVRNILGNEFCERFSYYGLRAILVLYFQRKLDWEKDSAISMFQYTNALAYFMPLLGGYVSDAKLGKYQTILYFSLVYVSGGVLLSCAAIDGIVWLSLFGLVLIGIGTGGIKPCVSSFGADQFTITHIQTHQQLLKREHEISSFFHFFYFAINMGSVGSFIFTPLLRQYLGYAVAFAVPAFLLAIATVVFWSARTEYHRNPPAGSVLLQLWQVFSGAIIHRNDHLPSTHPTLPLDTREALQQSTVASSTAPHNWLDRALCEPTITASQVENAKSVWRVLPIFSVLITFWMLFEQQGSAWTFQAESMKLHGLQPEQLGVFNPVLIMILLPLFDRCVYPLVDRCGIQFHSLRRMGVGMLVSILAFLLSAGVQYQITRHPPSSVSVFWQLPQIALISIAEILISVTGLEFAYTQAAPALKSTVTALFLLTTAIGNLLTGVLYSSLSKRFDDTQMYLLFAGLMVLNFFVFLIVAYRYQSVVVLDEKIRSAQEEQQTEEERAINKDTDDQPGVADPIRLQAGRESASEVELVSTEHRAPRIKRASTTLLSFKAPEEEV